MIALVVMAAGCGSVPDYKYVTTIAGGQRIEVPITSAGPEHAHAGGLTVTTAQFFVNPRDPRVFLAFAFRNESGQALRSVRVEDVADAAPVLVVEDLAPKMAGGEWRGLTPALTSFGPPIEWIRYLDASNRVYRFTVTLADGRTVVLNQLAVFPGWMKAGVRNSLEAKQAEAHPAN